MTTREPKLKLIEDRIKATDEEILNLYKNGWFLNQIKRHYKVGLKRLRRIARDYDRSQC